MVPVSIKPALSPTLSAGYKAFLSPTLPTTKNALQGQALRVLYVFLSFYKKIKAKKNIAALHSTGNFSAKLCTHCLFSVAVAPGFVTASYFFRPNPYMVRLKRRKFITGVNRLQYRRACGSLRHRFVIIFARKMQKIPPNRLAGQGAIAALLPCALLRSQRLRLSIPARPPLVWALQFMNYFIIILIFQIVFINLNYYGIYLNYLQYKHRLHLKHMRNKRNTFPQMLCGIKNNTYA